MHFSTITSLAIMAYAALASATPSSNSTKVGCMADSDCPYGKMCDHNICVSTPSPSAPPMSSSAPSYGCNSNYDCENRYPEKSAYCEHNICVIPPTSSWTPHSESVPYTKPTWTP